MQMAIAAKRHLGVGLPFIGGNLLTTGALAYVAPPKVLKTDQALQAAIAGTMVLGDWTKLIGLLNHLVCLLLMPVTSMYEVYTISDASRQARVGLDEPIVRTPRGVTALQAWLVQVRTVAGTTALSAALQLGRAFLISRSVLGPAPQRWRAGGGKQKQKTEGGAGGPGFKLGNPPLPALGQVVGDTLGSGPDVATWVRA